MTTEKEHEELKRTIKQLTCRVEKLEAIVFFSADIDARLNTIIKTEEAVYSVYDIDVSYFSNDNPVKMRKRGHHFSAAQKAFFALLKLLREQDLPYNFLDAYYKTGSFKKVLEFTQYIDANDKERGRYNEARNKLLQ